MSATVTVRGRPIGDGAPTYVIAEIGINHNGDIAVAKQLVDAAVLSGCDAVKFQKRTPELAVPEHQRCVMRETPWGLMTYLEYRHRIEFGHREFVEIDRYCAENGIPWFVFVLDAASVAFIEQFEPPCYKVASASLTDGVLLDAVKDTQRPVFLSTGMSTMDEIRSAVDVLGTDRLLLAHATSTYPCPTEELNLRMMATLRAEFDVPVGYSGHEVGLPTTVVAVAIGAAFVERHITLNRAMWGSDQAASVEPGGFMRLVRDIRAIELAMGDGVKHVYESELPIREKLRRTP